MNLLILLPFLALLSSHERKEKERKEREKRERKEREKALVESVCNCCPSLVNSRKAEAAAAAQRRREAGAI